MNRKSSILVKDWIGKYRSELILMLLWIFAIAIINPIGEFPLNDDWAYSQNVFHLSQEGKIILSDWPAMTLIAQVLWGALVTSIFGFSFTVLRVSSLFIGLLTVLLFYRILKKITFNENTSLAGALLIMFTPLFFSSSYTFMTEVYFLFSLNLSFFYFFKFYETERTKFLLISSFFVLISSLIRQPGVAVGLAFTFIYLLKKNISIKRIIISLTPTIVGIVGLILYSLWLHITHRDTNISNISILLNLITHASLEYYLIRIGVIALYFGLFSLPISIVLVPEIIKNTRYLTKGIILIVFCIAVISRFLDNFPKGNVFYNLGLGPKLLKDAYWGENINPVLPDHTLYIVKLLSLFSALIVSFFFFKELFAGIKKYSQTRNNPIKQIRATFLVFFIIYLSFVIINPIFFDRYILPCIPSVLIILLPIKPLFNRTKGLVFGLIITVYILFSIAATHDYMSWNRARWKAINYLTNEKKIERHKIDGGFEFNAWYQTGGCNPIIKDRISWWFVSSDNYVISFGNINGFEPIKTIEYNRMLPPGRDSIYILFKEEKRIPYSEFPIRCDCEKKSIDGNFFLSESMNVEFIGGTQQSNKEFLSGQHSIKLDSINKYGLLSKYNNIQTGERFIVKVWRKGLDDRAGIVISAEPGHNLSHFNNQAIQKNSKKWELIQSEIEVPENCNGLKLGVYLWNPGQNPVWFDDLEIIKLPNTSK